MHPGRAASASRLSSFSFQRGEMHRTLQSHAEPIPGYRLIERIGAGGFGEVWKAEAPGGLLKAVKIIQGTFRGAGPDETRLDQELKSLNRVKTVRHPYILGLDRFEIVNGRLIIVSELADRSLFDRFKECRSQGQAGIPREELLSYMTEAAEALDLMNQQFNLQHLDVKPQNIFLLFNHVKVGDFGLVKDLEGMFTAITSGLTAVYAAPETFEGVVSRYCDQYNLAIAYQEMLTGELPFKGTTGRQLMMQHLTGAHNLTPLPPTDRPVVARALSRKPEERFASCVGFVQALAQAGASTACPENGTAPEHSEAETAPEVQLSEKPTSVIRPQGKKTLSGVQPSIPPEEHPAFATPNSKPAAGKPSGRSTDYLPLPPPPDRPETTGDGILVPALVVGLGGLGRRVLQEFRSSLRKRGPAETWPNIRLLNIDTDSAGLERATQEPDSVLSPDEILVTPFQGLSHHLKRHHAREELERWLPFNQLMNVPRGQTAAGGWRALGRLAFVTSGNTVPLRLRQELEACADERTLNDVARRTALGLRTTRPRVYVVTSLTGGTGSGIFIDVAAVLRRALLRIGHGRAELIAVLLVPAVNRNAEARGVANSYAALTELKHFAAVEKDAGNAGPFDRCVLLPLSAKTEGAVALQESVSLAGDFLSRELTSGLGRVADEARKTLKHAGASLACQTFGAYWFSVPRRPLLHRVVHHIFDRLVRGWGIHDAKALAALMNRWAIDQLTQAKLSSESLPVRIEEACAAKLGQPPETWFSALVQRWAKRASGDLTKGPMAVRKAMQELEEALGPPKSEPDLNLACPVITALAEGCPSVAKAAERQLAELALAALSEPSFRLACKEEAAQEQLGTVLKEASRWYQHLSEERREQAYNLWQKIPPVITELQIDGMFRGRAKARAAAAIAELSSQCLSARWNSLLSLAASRLCEDLRVNLHKYYRALRCCHKRIGQLLGSFVPAASDAPVDLGLGRYLLPFGCQTLEEAVARILDSLPPEDEQALHGNVSKLLRSTLRQSLHVCTAPASLFRELREEIDREVEKLAEDSLGRAHAAAVYLERQADQGDADTDLAGAFDEAQPELGHGQRAARRAFSILAVPPGPEGERFRALVKHALPGEPMRSAATTDDIVFYREQSFESFDELPQLSPAAREQYQQILSTAQFGPHSRVDIAW
jgi:serine/threonine protein kinase